MLKNLRNKLMEKKNKKGFTLIELIIVIAIIAILAALLLPKLGAVKENSNKTSDIANGKKIAEAALGLYADGTIAQNANVATKLDGSGAANSDQKAIEDYIQSIPKVKSKTNSLAGKNFYVTVDKNDGTVKVYAAEDDSDPDTLVYPTHTSKYDGK